MLAQYLLYFVFEAGIMCNFYWKITKLKSFDVNERAVTIFAKILGLSHECAHSFFPNLLAKQSCFISWIRSNLVSKIFYFCQLTVKDFEKKYSVCGVFRANRQNYMYSEPIIYQWDHMVHVNRFCFLIGFEWSTFVSRNRGLVWVLRNSITQRYRNFSLSATSRCRNYKKWRHVYLQWHCTVYRKFRK